MRIAALIGEPATGKTTIARALIDDLSPGERFKRGLIVGSRHALDKVIVLGNYSDPNHKFSGTDRMSMACQPEVELFLAQTRENAPHWSIFFEGDRLGNISFLRRCESIAETQIYFLETDYFLKKERHEKRGDNQTEKFLRSRQTKVANIVKEFPSAIKLINENESDIKDLSDLIRDFVAPSRNR